MISKLILGTVQFGLNYGVNNSVGKLSENEVFEILETAYNLGIRTIDTAEAYGDSHKIISNFHKNFHKKFNIITKYSPSNFKYPGEIIQRINAHCLDFNIDYLEGYMFHSYIDFINSFNKDPKILNEILASGLVKKIGVSVYSNDEIEDLLNFKNISFIQLPFNLFDNEYQRRKIIEKAKERNVEIHTRSVFLQGLFFKNSNTLNTSFSSLKSNLAKLETLTQTHNIGMNSLALNYVIDKKYIDKVLIGVDSLTQLIKNIESLKNELDASIFKKIDSLRIENTKLLNPSNWKI